MTDIKKILDSKDIRKSLLEQGSDFSSIGNKLREVVQELDYLMNEGVVMTPEVKSEFTELVDHLSMVLKDFYMGA